MAKIDGLGSGGYRQTQHFYQLLTELAYKKQHAIQTSDEPVKASGLINQLRDEVKRLDRVKRREPTLTCFSQKWIVLKTIW